MAHALKMGVHWKWECVGPTGEVKWVEEYENLVVNAGLDSVLDVYFSSATQITTWYVGLINGATPTLAAGDTSASHAGWTENQNYSQANRPTWVEAGVSAQAITNTSSPAQFSIDTDTQTISGGFLISDNTKGGATGVLFSEGEFSSDRNADDGDTLNVTVTIGAADDGV